jgi:hypothetical protein
MELRALVGVSEVNRGAANVIGNLLALAWALRMRSAVVSSMSRWVCKSLDAVGWSFDGL